MERQGQGPSVALLPQTPGEPDEVRQPCPKEPKTKVDVRSVPPKGSISISRAWKYDIFFCTVSVVAVIALIILLLHEDGQAQRSWAHGAVTLNGVISILATIARAALSVPVATALSQGKWAHFNLAPNRRIDRSRPLSDFVAFDAASRGVLGSLKLLWTIRWRWVYLRIYFDRVYWRLVLYITESMSRQIASVGAAITILAIAVDPFTQQVLGTTYRNVAAKLNQSLLIPRVDRYDDYQNNNYEDATLGISAAITSAITAPVKSLGVGCPTGNCTWPIQSTLAVCGECSAINANISWACPASQDGLSCRGTIQQGNVTFDPYYQDNIFAISAGSRNSTYYKDPLIPYLTIFQVWQSPAWKHLNQTAPLPSQQPNATECALWFCVQAYNISVQQGVQSQSTVSTWSEYVQDPKATANATDHFAQPSQVGDMVTQPIPPPNWLLHPDPKNMSLAADTWFSIEDFSLRNMADQLYTALQGRFSLTYGYETGTGKAGDYPSAIGSSSDSMGALFKARTDIGPFVSNLALSLTNHIRMTAPSTQLNTTIVNGTINGTTLNPQIQGYNTILDTQTNVSNSTANPQPSDLVYAGTALSSEAFFHVRWAWLVLPILLVILTPVFLFITIWQSSRNNVPIWAEAPLALMHCSADDNVKKKLGIGNGQTVNRKEVERRAEEVMVSLVKDSGGKGVDSWGFREEGGR